MDTQNKILVESLLITMDLKLATIILSRTFYKGRLVEVSLRMVNLNAK
jgi:hypothetical protein